MCAGPISVASLPGTADELCWEAISREAMESHDSGRNDDAALLWQQAGMIARTFPDGDPRHAASRNNIAVAEAVAGRCEEAERGFRDARSAWTASRDWSSFMQVSGTARSSLFHHRLEMKHRDSFQSHLRRRYCHWIDAAEAATAFNHGIVLLALDRDEAGREQMLQGARLRGKASGANDPGYCMMLGILEALKCAPTGPQEVLTASCSPEDQVVRSALTRWSASKPPQMDDVRRLLAATCLTAVFDQANFL